MYSDIQTYFNSVITLVNAQLSGTANDLVENTGLLDINNVPANTKNNYYQIKFEEIEDVDDKESRNFDDVTVIIELWFLLAKDRTNYKNALDKLRLIKQGLKKSTMTEGTDFSILDIDGIKVRGLNNIISDNWLRPTIEFHLQVADKK